MNLAIAHTLEKTPITQSIFNDIPSDFRTSQSIEIFAE
jgi:hypothetical protein